MWFSQDYNIYSGSSERFGVFLAYFSWARFGSIGLAVTATVAMVALLKWLSLSSGGKVVAESMGGTRILPGTLDPAERRCLNVVEEIALAAKMPVPPVYVMNDESRHQCLCRRPDARRRGSGRYPRDNRSSQKR